MSASTATGRMAATGDRRTAFAERLARDEPAARATVAVLLPSRDQIAPCLTDAFVAAYRDHGDPLETALELARRRRREWLARERARRGYRADLEQALDAALEAQAQGAAAIASSLSARIAALPPVAREVLSARYQHGETLGVIAAARERTEAWARAALLRSHQALTSAKPLGEALDRLTAALLSDGLTEGEGRELAHAAAHSMALRERLAEHLALHRLLPELSAPPSVVPEVLALLRERSEAARDDTITSDEAPAVPRRLPVATPRPWRLALVLLVLAIVGVVGLVVAMR
jgi:hypothetical protein